MTLSNNSAKMVGTNHKLAITCVCISSDDSQAFSASKDGSIRKWCLKTKKIIDSISSISKNDHENDKKLKKRHHFRHINCIAISSDDKFLATGGWDKLIRIYSPDDMSWIHTFEKHRQEITALAFRRGHSLLYSGSADRAVILWTLEDDDNRCFVDDLYGHESSITSMDILRKERVLTSGGRDQTIRIWKIVEQAQTVYQTSHESVDITRFIDDKLFVSGGEDGNISVWSTMKRTPIVELPKAHPIMDKNLKKLGVKGWITALATYPLKQQSSKSPLPRKKRKIDYEDLRNNDEDESSDDDKSGSSSEEDIQEEDVNNESQHRILGVIASGSCNSEVKVWILVKYCSTYELKLKNTFICDGFVNDLRFTSNGRRLIAACAPEHRLGRWWKIPTSNYIHIKDVNIPGVSDHETT